MEITAYKYIFTCNAYLKWKNQVISESSKQYWNDYLLIM